MPSHRVTDADLERWVSDGIISAAQRDAILRDLATRPEAEGGLNLTTLLYYGGGLLVLLAYSVFLGLQWDSLNPAGRSAISGASLGFFAVVSQLLLRSERYQLPGELLQVVAIAVVPLLGYAILDAAGWWPHEPTYYVPADRKDYQLDLVWARMALGAITMLAAVAGFRLSRSPFVLIAAVVAFTSLVVDISFQFQRPGEVYEWHTGQALAVAGMGAVVLASGIASRGRSERDYSLWLYVAGLAGLAVGLVPMVFDQTSATAWGVLWVVVALGVLGLALPLQQRLFAAAGLAAIFGYLAKLVFDVFASANAALILVVLGLVVLGLGMLYQRYSERIFGQPAGT